MRGDFREQHQLSFLIRNLSTAKSTAQFGGAKMSSRRVVAGLPLLQEFEQDSLTDEYLLNFRCNSKVHESPIAWSVTSTFTSAASRCGRQDEHSLDNPRFRRIEEMEARMQAKLCLPRYRARLYRKITLQMTADCEIEQLPSKSVEPNPRYCSNGSQVDRAITVLLGVKHNVPEIIGVRRVCVDPHHEKLLVCSSPSICDSALEHNQEKNYSIITRPVIDSAYLLFGDSWEYKGDWVVSNDIQVFICQHESHKGFPCISYSMKHSNKDHRCPFYKDHVNERNRMLLEVENSKKQISKLQRQLATCEKDMFKITGEQQGSEVTTLSAGNLPLGLTKKKAKKLGRLQKKSVELTGEVHKLQESVEANEERVRREKSSSALVAVVTNLAGQSQRLDFSAVQFFTESQWTSNELKYDIGNHCAGKHKYVERFMCFDPHHKHPIMTLWPQISKYDSNGNETPEPRTPDRQLCSHHEHHNPNHVFPIQNYGYAINPDWGNKLYKESTQIILIPAERQYFFSMKDNLQDVWSVPYVEKPEFRLLPPGPVDPAVLDALLDGIKYD